MVVSGVWGGGCVDLSGSREWPPACDSGSDFHGGIVGCDSGSDFHSGIVGVGGIVHGKES